MPEPVDTETRLTEKQVAAVLRRAAELQEGGGKRDLSAHSGILPSDLVQIGSELGLDQECIREAILEIEAGESRAGNAGFLGRPVRQEAERLFDGELTDEVWDGIVAEARRTFGKAGTSTVVGGVREWSTGDTDIDSVTVSVHGSNGKVHVRVASNMTNGAVLAVVLGVIFSLVPSLLIAQKGTGTAFEKLMWMGLALAVVLLTVRGIYVGSTKRRSQAIRHMVQRSGRLLAQSTSRIAHRTSHIGHRASLVQGELPVEAEPEEHLHERR